uniref:Uncharacterized protein n=1 Tax=Anguilla anguilla TaxID=7936 RepID=A0A0E9R6T7_ANGAN
MSMRSLKTSMAGGFSVPRSIKLESIDIVPINPLMCDHKQM